MKKQLKNKSPKIIFNGAWPLWGHSITLLFKIEKWNPNDAYYGIRFYFLFWEFNFSIRNNPKNVKDFPPKEPKFIILD